MSFSGLASRRKSVAPLATRTGKGHGGSVVQSLRPDYPGATLAHVETVDKPIPRADPSVRSCQLLAPFRYALCPENSFKQDSHYDCTKKGGRS